MGTARPDRQGWDSSHDRRGGRPDARASRAPKMRHMSLGPPSHRPPVPQRHSATRVATAIMSAGAGLLAATSFLLGGSRRRAARARRIEADAALEEAIAAEEQQRHLSEIASDEFDMQG